MNIMQCLRVFCVFAIGSISGVPNNLRCDAHSCLFPISQVHTYIFNVLTIVPFLIMYFNPNGLVFHQSPLLSSFLFLPFSSSLNSKIRQWPLHHNTYKFRHLQMRERGRRISCYHRHQRYHTFTSNQYN